MEWTGNTEISGKQKIIGETIMWGICLDILAEGGNLFQKVVEYQLDSASPAANILQPTKGIQISINAIKPIDEPPEFVYGDFVSPVNHSDIKGKIETIFYKINISFLSITIYMKFIYFFSNIRYNDNGRCSSPKWEGLI